jgi:heme/copper-type cytochrome/quinol oxidase subunit 4
MSKAKTAKPCKGQTSKKQLTESVTSTSVIVKLSIVVISGECSDRYIVAVFAFDISSKYKVVRVCVRVVTFMHKNNEGGTGHKFSITVNVIIIIFRLVDSTIFTVCFQTLKY